MQQIRNIKFISGYRQETIDAYKFQESSLEMKLMPFLKEGWVLKDGIVPDPSSGHMTCWIQTIVQYQVEQKGEENQVSEEQTDEEEEDEEDDEEDSTYEKDEDEEEDEDEETDEDEEKEEKSPKESQQSHPRSRSYSEDIPMDNL